MIIFRKGANIQVYIVENGVEIISTRSLPKGLKIEDFGKYILLRNPNIVNLMHRFDYIEKMGTGIKRKKNFLDNEGLSPAEFNFSDFVTVKFSRLPFNDITSNVGDNRRNKILEIIK